MANARVPVAPPHLPDAAAEVATFGKSAGCISRGVSWLDAIVALEVFGVAQ
jgi:hypothetical protein